MARGRSTFFALLICAVLLPRCDCDPPVANPLAWPDLSARQLAENRRPSSLKPPKREPGPARMEARARVKKAGDEASSLTATLRESGVDAREVASIADMRGYRLYRKRYFRQAQSWFEAAVKVDPSFEPALLNAARCAMLLKDQAKAARMLSTLGRLNTPLARSRLALARMDPDFAALWESLRKHQ